MLLGLFGKTVTLSDNKTVVADENYIRESILNPQAKLVQGFGPVMPYGAIGRMRSDAHGTVPIVLVPVSRTISDRSSINRYTAGVRLSLLVPKIAVEVTKAEVTSYAAKISFGF